MPEQPDNLFWGKLFTECTVLEQFSYSLHGLLFVSSNTAETKKLVLCCEIVSPPHLFYFLFFIFYFLFYFMKTMVMLVRPVVWQYLLGHLDWGDSLEDRNRKDG